MDERGFSLAEGGKEMDKSTLFLVMIELAVANKIDLFLLLGHTTHMCQPLDVGVFGPGQKAWAQQCDLHLAETGRSMRKEDVVGEYMKAREKSFSEKTVISAWIKCSIRPSADGVSGVDAFKLEQFARSNNTSTYIHLPETFPSDPPSDFEPWPTQGKELAVEDEQSSNSDWLTMGEFWQMWEAQDGTVASGSQMSEESSSDSEGEEKDINKLENVGEGEGRWRVMVDDQGQESTPISYDQCTAASEIAAQSSSTCSPIAMTSSSSPIPT